MSESLIKINAKIIHVVYHNDSSFYTVVRLKMNDEQEKTITATGFFTNIEVDVLYNFYGQYIDHPRYGMQFQIQSYQKPLPSEKEGIIRYLSGIEFPGIGHKTAEKIVEVLGDHCLTEIRKDPTILKQVGLKEKVIAIITEGLSKEDDGMEELVQFLNIHGIGTRNLVRLNKAYGKEALDKLKENPYRVIEECDGFGFKTADKIAMSLGFEASDERRLYAYLVSLCMELCMKTGDSYVFETTLESEFLKRCGNLCQDYDSLLSKALIKRSLVKEFDRIFPVTQYDSEDGISTCLSLFPESELPKVDGDLLETYLFDMQKDLSITYDEKQLFAIKEFFNHPFTILTGGPGTGKTTVVRAMVKLFQLLYPSSTVVCAAPTGRAAKRLSELTDNGAMTLHSLLKWDLETNSFGMDEKEPILADLLIVDEFSMVDNWLFYHLMLASKKIKKICVIGDENQLPSVSPGSVLRELITSEIFPVIRLEHIYRQKQGSDVIELAHDIRNGTVNFEHYKNDVMFFECSKYDIKHNVISIVQNALDKGYDFQDIQVLSPMYGGPSGIDVLNSALQETFNPYDPLKNEVKVGYRIFREGDKILQLKNQPDDDVFNGDIGTLVEIESGKHSETGKTTLYVQFEDAFVEYSLDNIANITLAYCISIHKSQGSEYPIVIMPITSSHTIMLQRKLIYTGVTRSRQALVLLGEKNAFMQGIETIDRHVRLSSLREKLDMKINQVNIELV